MHFSALSLLSLAIAANASPLSPGETLPGMLDISDLKNEMHNAMPQDFNKDESGASKTSTEVHASFTTVVSSSASASPSPSSPGSLFSPMAGSTCPPSRPSKQCCSALSSLADEVTGANGLGSVLPWAQGIQVSSLLGLQCFSMDPTADASKCADTFECCEAPSPEVAEKQKAGEQALFKGGCMPFENAWNDQRKKDAKASSSAAAAAASSSAPAASESAAPMRV
ncbi:hypothetical protein BDV18DRAFT_141503 [Aspergillus unguis]